jgi:ElaB/YqjD/DUF883 family membrane-anchored ribosome-binding protein
MPLSLGNEGEVVRGRKMVTQIDELRDSFEELKQTRRELLPRLRFHDPEVRDLRERLENSWKRLRRRMRRLVPAAEANVSADVEEAESLLAELRERYEELRQFLEAPESPTGGNGRSSHGYSRSSGRRSSLGDKAELRRQRRDREVARWNTPDG